MSLLPLVRIWIWVSTLATTAGWLLSATGQLNRVGYTLFIGATIGAFVVWRVFARQQGRGSERVGQSNHRTPFDKLISFLKRVRQRFRRGLPCCFAVLALLVFVGGAIYPPSNHTALTYRTPRVLHWLAEGRWHWIHTPDYRMNNRACGIEWLSAPFLLFTRSDRSLFLLNFIPFLLMPGLIFSLCARLGVQRRVAWQWMWVLPTGYSFLLQAGSTGNDAFPTLYALAAADFACRAWASRKAGDVWLSILSAALLTGAKASNLPLLLPWAVLIAGVFLVAIRQRPLTTGLLLLVAGLVSFVPTAALNIHYCGDWSGLKLEHIGMDMKNPLVGIWGNAFLLLLNNFAPPFFPQAGWWNQSAPTFLPHALMGPMTANFEPGFLTLGEMPTEDWVGIGFGVSLLMMVAGIFSLLRPKPVPPRRILPETVRRLALIAPWLALLAYCMKSGMVTGARLISPYYPLLLPALIASGAQAELIRRRWWRVLVWAVMLLAFPVLMVTPGRPLWPARTMLTKALELKPGNRLLTRALTVYNVYAARSDPLAAARSLLPPDLKLAGFMGTEDDIDISLWRPLGKTKVEHILLRDSPEQIRQRHLEYILVGGYYLASHNTNLAEWLGRMDGEVVGTLTATQKVSEGPQQWYLVKLKF